MHQNRIHTYAQPSQGALVTFRAGRSAAGSRRMPTCSVGSIHSACRLRVEVQHAHIANTGERGNAVNKSQGLMIATTGIATLCLSGCGPLTSGLSGQSTCKEFNEAPISEQRQVIMELVTAKEDGRSNPLRESNAVMQITYTCQAPGQDETILSKIAI